MVVEGFFVRGRTRKLLVEWGRPYNRAVRPHHLGTTGNQADIGITARIRRIWHRNLATHDRLVQNMDKIVLCVLYTHVLKSVAMDILDGCLK